MKKLTFTLLLLLAFVGFATIKADTYIYSFETYDGQGYNLETGAFINDYAALSSTEKLTLGNNITGNEIALTSLNFHHMLFFDKNNRYIGYINGNATTLEYDRYLGYDASASTPLPSNAAFYVIQNYDYEDVRDLTAQTNTTIDAIAWGSYTYRDIFGDSLHSTGKNNLIENGDFANGTADWSILGSNQVIEGDRITLYGDNTTWAISINQGALSILDDTTYYSSFYFDTNDLSNSKMVRLNPSTYLYLYNGVDSPNGQNSIIITTEQSYGSFQLFNNGYTDHSPTTSEYSTFGDIILLNLDTIFTGEQPTVEEMDQLLIEYKEITDAPATVSYRDIYDDTVNEYDDYQQDFAIEFFEHKNLFDFTQDWQYKDANLSRVFIENGFIFSNDPASQYDKVQYFVQLKGGTTYNLSALSSRDCSGGGGVIIRDAETDDVFISSGNFLNPDFTFTTYEKGSIEIQFYVSYATSEFCTTEWSNIQLEEGSTATAYEPYNPVTVEDYGTITGQEFIQDYGVDYNNIINSYTDWTINTSSSGWTSAYMPLSSFDYNIKDNSVGSVYTNWASLNIDNDVCVASNSSSINGYYDVCRFIIYNSNLYIRMESADLTAFKADILSASITFISELAEQVEHTDLFYLDHDSETFVNLSNIYGEYDEPSNSVYETHFAVYVDPVGDDYSSYLDVDGLSLIGVSYIYSTDEYEPDVDTDVESFLDNINMNTEGRKIFVSIAILIAVVILAAFISKSVIITMILSAITFLVLTFMGWLPVIAFIICIIILIILAIIRAKALGGRL